MGITADAKCIATALENEHVGVSTSTLYPNPAKDKLAIHFTESNNEKLSCAVYNTTGHLVLEKELQSNGINTELDINHLPQGVYVLKIKGSNCTTLHSFLKE